MGSDIQKLRQFAVAFLNKVGDEIDGKHLVFATEKQRDNSCA